MTGVGPALAVKILSGLAVERTVAAIRSHDHAMLTHIPGVGKKLAERLVLELKDKLEDMAIAPAMGVSAGPAADDVLSALVNLGYQRPAAFKGHRIRSREKQGRRRELRRTLPRGVAIDSMKLG